MKKNVCMVAYTNYPSDARVRREAETLASTGDYDVSFLTLKEGDQPRAYELENVKVIELNARKFGGGNKIRHMLSYLRFLFLAFRGCSQLFLSGRLDIVHVHNMPNFLVFAGIIPRLAGKKMILDIHDSTPETYFAKYGKRPDHFMFRILCWEEALCCAIAHRVICVNHVQRDELVQRGIPPRKITISMNVPDPKWFGNANPGRQSPSNRGKRLVYHGTVAKRLGVDLAIRAFAKACGSNGDMEFFILGEGDGIAECMELTYCLDLDGNVHLTRKMLPLEALLDFLEDMDIGIVANRVNIATDLMLPVKLMEYVALEIPAIVPRLRAIEHYFTDDMVTYFEPENVDSLAEAMMELSRNENKRKTQAEKAKSFLDRYGWETHRMDLIELYREI